jgi:hypothetical protein
VTQENETVRGFTLQVGDCPGGDGHGCSGSHGSEYFVEV